MSNRNTLSPTSRRALREEAEAAAMAELEFNASQRREKSRRLRLKRLAQEEKNLKRHAQEEKNKQSATT